MLNKDQNNKKAFHSTLCESTWMLLQDSEHGSMKELLRLASMVSQSMNTLLL